jgi:hypothetical protein
MKHLAWLAATGMFIGVFPQIAVAQAAPVPRPPAREIEGLYHGAVGRLTAVASAMPADRYDFRPRAGADTFAELVNKVSGGQHDACDEVNETPKAERTSVPPATAGKDAVLAALKASTDACMKAYARMNEANYDAQMVSGPARHGMLSILAWNWAHNSEVAGTMTEYLAEAGVALPKPAPPAAPRP